MNYRFTFQFSSTANPFIATLTAIDWPLSYSQVADSRKPQYFKVLNIRLNLPNISLVVLNRHSITIVL